MSTGQDPDSGEYEIRVRGHLEARWASWFDGLTLTKEIDGTTSIRGPVVDQAGLHGLLRKLRDTGLPLVSVIELDDDRPALHPTTHRTTVGDPS